MNGYKNNSHFNHSSSTSCTFKLSGWSVSRHNGASLRNQLENIGTVTGFVHYPELSTTYVTIQLSNQRRIFRLCEQFPHLQIERLSSAAVLETEKGQQYSETTAFVASHQYLSDIELYSELSRHGRIRALKFGFSNKTRQWNCKVSFYEKYSLEQLFPTVGATNLYLSNGTSVRIERIRDTTFYSHSKQTSSPSSFFPPSPNLINPNIPNICTRRKVSPRDTLYRQSQPTQGTNSRGLRTKMQNPRRYVSKSCGRSREPILPDRSIFKSFEMYLENSLKIARSHRNECRLSGEGMVDVPRSKSLDRPSNAICLRLDRQLLRINSSVRSMPSGTFGLSTFKESELLFGQIGKISKEECCSVQVKTEVGTPLACQGSYLSVDDKSDGISVLELPVIKPRPSFVYNPVSTSPAISNKYANNKPTVEYTHVSSETKLTDDIRGKSHYPAKFSFDHYFGCINESTERTEQTAALPFAGSPIYCPRPSSILFFSFPNTQ